MQTLKVKALVDKQTYNFLINDDFIHYIVDSNQLLQEKWSNYFSSHPDELPYANKAKLILQGKLDVTAPSTEDISEMKNNIFETCKIYRNN
mgnify:CR=1 FL=1